MEVISSIHVAPKVTSENALDKRYLPFTAPSKGVRTLLLSGYNIFRIVVGAAHEQSRHSMPGSIAIHYFVVGAWYRTRTDQKPYKERDYGEHDYNDPEDTGS